MIMRNTTRYKVGKYNPLWNLYRTVSVFKVARNFIFIEMGRFSPSTKMKHFLYRKFLKMKLDDKVSFAYKAMPDLMHPEKIHIGKNRERKSGGKGHRAGAGR